MYILYQEFSIGVIAPNYYIHFNVKYIQVLPLFLTPPQAFFGMVKKEMTVKDILQTAAISIKSEEAPLLQLQLPVYSQINKHLFAFL